MLWSSIFVIPLTNRFLKQGDALVVKMRSDLIVPEIHKFLDGQIEFFVCLKIVLVHQFCFQCAVITFYGRIIV